MKKINNAYKRFLGNFQLKNGVYLYPEYQSDLMVILEFTAKALEFFNYTNESEKENE